MMERRNSRAWAAAGLALLMWSTAGAQSAWVSDQFEITLRTGPSTSNAIQRMLPSGTQLEILERDEESGYTRVRTRGGTEGWVISRYLMDEPSAREQLAELSQQVSSANERGSTLTSQLSTIRSEYRTAENRIQTLERENERLKSELDEIKRTAANVLAIDSQNKTLQEQLTDAEIQLSALEEQNRELASQTRRNWFIAGAGVMFGGVLVGLILPRIRWQRRSRYDSF